MMVLDLKSLTPCALSAARAERAIPAYGVESMLYDLIPTEDLLFFDDTPGLRYCWASCLPSGNTNENNEPLYRLNPFIYLTCTRPFKHSFLTPNGLDSDASWYVAGDLLSAYANTGDAMMDERKASFLAHPGRDTDYRNFLSNGRVERRKAPNDPDSAREWISLLDCFDSAVRHLHLLSHATHKDEVEQSLNTLTSISRSHTSQIGCPKTWKKMKAIIVKCLKHAQSLPDLKNFEFRE